MQHLWQKIEDDYSGDLKGLSLSLSDDIGLNLVMQLSDSLLIDKDNAYVEFTLEGSKNPHVYILRMQTRLITTEPTVIHLSIGLMPQK